MDKFGIEGQILTQEDITRQEILVESIAASIEAQGKLLWGSFYLAHEKEKLAAMEKQLYNQQKQKDIGAES